MKLYSEWHGKKAPQEKTYSISRYMYSLLLDCYERYRKNLTHMFTLNCHNDFTDSDYIEFDENWFATRIKTRIPSLFRNESDKICAPQHGDEYNQYSLLDLIEFFTQNIRDISERWNNDRYRNYQTIDCLSSSNVFVNFKKEINDVFSESGLLAEIEDIFISVQEQGLREFLKDAVVLYKTPSLAAR